MGVVLRLARHQDDEIVNRLPNGRQLKHFCVVSDYSLHKSGRSLVYY